MLNKVIMQGRVVTDLEVKYTQVNVAVCSFTIACERNFTPKGQEKQSDFINCVAWRQTAEFISKYFSKGRMIYISGSLQSWKYQDKQGNNRTVFEVMVEEAFFGDSAKSGESSHKSEKPDAAKELVKKAMQQGVEVQYEDVSTDDDSVLPF